MELLQKKRETQPMTESCNSLYNIVVVNETQIEKTKQVTGEKKYDVPKKSLKNFWKIGQILIGWS